MAYDLFQGKGARGSAEVDADNWIDHPDAGRYTVHEDSLCIAKDLLLTLLWWKNESQILDLDEDSTQLRAIFYRKSNKRDSGWKCLIACERIASFSLGMIAIPDT